MKLVSYYSKLILRLRISILFLMVFIAGFSSAQVLNIYENDTLAVINGKVISTSDFLQSYKGKVAKYGLSDNGETRFKYLLNLVNDELLIAEAKNQNLNNTPEAEKELKRIKLQELLNAYSEKHISPKIILTEDDLKDLYIKMNMRLKVSHLYASNKIKADSLYQELINGKLFEELAEENFEDPRLRDNGGSLGYITIDEMDSEFEKKAYSMRIGEISEPVKTVTGYSIIRVEDIKSNLFLTENEYLKIREKLKSFARKRAYEDASKEFAHSLSESLNIKFNDKIIAKIYKAIKDKDLNIYLENKAAIFSDDLSDIVIHSKIGNWDLKTLFNELSIITDKQKLWIKSEENLRDLIKGLINRKYISQESKKENLDKTSSYHKKVEFTFDTYLLTSIENELKKEIKIPLDSVENYYKNNINLFTTEPEIRLSSILVDDKILSDSIKNLLEKGESFENLAEKFSIQKETAKIGGDMGYFTKKDLLEISSEVFSLNINEWAGPFNQDNKYAFLKCTAYREPLIKSFNEVKNEIENNLAAFEWYKFRENYIELLKEKIPFQIFPKKLNSLNLLTKVDQNESYD